MRHTSVAMGVGALLAAQTAAADGTWRTYARDFQRTARVPGVGAMQAPAVAWKRYMGGALATNQALIADVDSDGRPDVVHASGGRVVASTADGSTLWQTALLGRPSVQGVWDLDGDGESEVVVGKANQTLVLSGKTGAEVLVLTMARPTSASFIPMAKGSVLVLGMVAGDLSGFDFQAGLKSVAPTWTVQDRAATDADRQARWRRGW